MHARATTLILAAVLAAVTFACSGGDDEPTQQDLSGALITLADLPDGWSESAVDEDQDEDERFGCGVETYVQAVPVAAAIVSYSLSEFGLFIVQEVGVYEDAEDAYDELEADVKACSDLQVPGDDGTGFTRDREITEINDDAGFGDESIRFVVRAQIFLGELTGAGLAIRRGDVISILAFVAIDSPPISDELEQAVAQAADDRLKALHQ